jgi:hypothetical protein
MESADERKERLRALRERAAAPDVNGEEEEQPTGVVLKFRNYNVRDQKQIAHENVSPLACKVSHARLMNM